MPATAGDYHGDVKEGAELEPGIELGDRTIPECEVKRLVAKEWRQRRRGALDDPHPCLWVVLKKLRNGFGRQQHPHGRRCADAHGAAGFARQLTQVILCLA